MTTLKDVPVGHIFRFTECDCMFRRDAMTHSNGQILRYAVVAPCGKHSGRRFKDSIAQSERGFGDADEEVRYDPFTAMLEEQL